MNRGRGRRGNDIVRAAPEYTCACLFFCTSGKRRDAPQRRPRASVGAGALWSLRPVRGAEKGLGTPWRGERPRRLVNVQDLAHDLLQAATVRVEDGGLVLRQLLPHDVERPLGKVGDVIAGLEVVICEQHRRRGNLSRLEADANIGEKAVVQKVPRGLTKLAQALLAAERAELFEDVERVDVWVSDAHVEREAVKQNALAQEHFLANGANSLVLARGGHAVGRPIAALLLAAKVVD
mmetsp:Transcript_9374/g.26589  ORF Transcript_9374/g.26589 Transcript_9374/m.26589 type:complete len:236 (-) Transcript_9374:403-1110(-)